MEDITLSIFVPTFNHENYIKTALDSILMQETKYTYEILVGDDVSQDTTRDILKFYEKKYPGRFKMFYRKQNMLKNSPDNAGDLMKRCKGKYIVALEGDDFWTDKKKIDTQINFLEDNPEYIAVAHNCIVVDQNSKIINEVYPECKDEEYTLKHFGSEIMPGQYTTIMYRNIFRMENVDTSILFKGLAPGDKILYFVLITHGRVYCLQKEMSAYRHVKEIGTSYSATYKYNFIEMEYWYKNLVDYAGKLKHLNAEKYAEALYVRNLMQGLKRKQCSIFDVISKLKNITHKFRSLYLWGIYKINKDLKHKKIWM